MLGSEVAVISCLQAMHAQNLPGTSQIDDLRFGYIMMKLNVTVVEPYGADGSTWHNPLITNVDFHSQ